MNAKLSLSIEEVQEISGLGKTKIYQLLKTGEIPAKKIGKRTLVLRSDLEAFLSGLQNYSEIKGDNHAC